MFWGIYLLCNHIVTGVLAARMGLHGSSPCCCVSDPTSCWCDSWEAARYGSGDLSLCHLQGRSWLSSQFLAWTGSALPSWISGREPADEGCLPFFSLCLCLSNTIKVFFLRLTTERKMSKDCACQRSSCFWFSLFFCGGCFLHSWTVFLHPLLP